MAAVITTQQLEANYDKFIAELTKLTRKYGVAIQSVGGVYLADDPDEFRGIRGSGWHGRCHARARCRGSRGDATRGGTVAVA